MKRTEHLNPNGTERKEIGSYRAAILDGNTVRVYQRDQDNNLPVLDGRKTKTLQSAKSARRYWESL